MSGPVQILRKDTISKPQEWIVRANLPENVLRNRRRDVDEENQQKVVIAREMSLARSALIAMSPTRGLDVAATDYVHRSLVRARDEGKAVLLISTDLDEILTLSDRVGVMLDGVLHETSQDARSREDVGRHMVGAGAAS